MRDERRSPCPVACALDLIGDRWTLLLVRDMACGKSQFKDFRTSPERIASNILADRLRRMVEAGLAERGNWPDGAGRESYRLTAKGETLMPVVDAIAGWGLAQIAGTEARMKLRRRG